MSVCSSVALSIVNSICSAFEKFGLHLSILVLNDHGQVKVLLPLTVLFTCRSGKMLKDYSWRIGIQIQTLKQHYWNWMNGSLFVKRKRLQ